jgi:hypothetical protein
MKRILLVMSVAALTAAMVLVTAVPAFATIHELARVPADNPDQASPVAGEFPPGLSDAEVPNLLPPPRQNPDADLTLGPENGSDHSDTLNSEGPLSEPTLADDPLVQNQPCRESGDGGSCEGNFGQAIVSVGQNPSGSQELADSTTNLPGDTRQIDENTSPKDLGSSNAFEVCSPSNDTLDLDHCGELTR